MNILVKVSEDRTCSGSIDTINHQIYILSFGDLVTPNTDVEIEFNIDQLKKLNETTNAAIKDYTDFQKAEKEKEKQKAKIYHNGSC